MTIVLLQFFWLSFLVIGLTELAVAAYFFKSVSKSQFVKFLLNQHFLVGALVLTCLGLSSFSLLILLGYLFHWPLAVLEVAYIAMIVVSVITGISQYKNAWSWLRKKVKLRKKTVLLLIIIGSILLVSFLVRLRSGGPIDGDSQIYIASVNQMAQSGHLTLADPYFGANGIMNLDYSANLLFALQALAVNLLHSTAVMVWQYSIGFYLVLVWLGFFALCRVFLDRSKSDWSYAVLVLSPLVFANFFQLAEAPNLIAVVWFTVFIIGLKNLYEKADPILFYVAAVLIVLTHDLNAVMAAGFLFLTIIVFALGKMANKKTFLILFVTAAALTVPEVVAYHYQSYLPSDSSQFNAATPLAYVHYGPFLLTKLPHIYFGALITLTYLLMIVYLLIFRKVKQRNLRLLLHLLFLVCLVLAFVPAYFSIPTYIYLIYRNKNKMVRVSLVLLFVYYLLLIYNPIFLKLAQHHIPLWAINRFEFFNVFTFIAPLIGLLLLAEWPLVVWGYKKLAAGLTVVMVFIILIASALFVSIYSTHFTTYVLADPGTVQKEQEIVLNSLKPIKADLYKQVIYTNSPTLPFVIPDLVLANVIDVPKGGAPMANSNLRDACAATLQRSLSLADLQAAGITVVLSDSSIIQGSSFNNIAGNRPYLYLEKTSGDYKVYRVKQLPRQSFYSKTPCLIPYGQ